jgi:hypothetical protein
MGRAFVPCAQGPFNFGRPGLPGLSGSDARTNEWALGGSHNNDIPSWLLPSSSSRSRRARATSNVYSRKPGTWNGEGDDADDRLWQPLDGFPSIFDGLKNE